MRANPLLEDIPIIVMSGTSEAVVRESFTDYDAFVEKPYAADSLLQLVCHFAAHGRAQEAGGSAAAGPKLDASLQRFLRGLKI
ncbi:hypothetical protein LRS03_20260 [Rhizobacter sp. J219]|uniref:hypothetical protein n=1 Tax=Rhizobacter sp. J219 TaxID=2898430 RepID=UPI0021513CC0|nr:hypothetical protein [Rhizobacter sp. J219]MCR5885068.1 hypothetical protein [Rhizobacter sp. J219]